MIFFILFKEFSLAQVDCSKQTTSVSIYSYSGNISSLEGCKWTFHIGTQNALMMLYVRESQISCEDVLKLPSGESHSHNSVRILKPGECACVSECKYACAHRLH